MGWNSEAVVAAEIISQGPIGPVFAQVVIANGQIEFNQSGSAAGPFVNDGTIGLVHLTGPSSGETVVAASGGFALSAAPGSSTGIFFMPASGDATGAQDTTLLHAIINVGYTPWLLPGTFYLNCGDSQLTGLGPGQYIIGSGYRNTFINAIGSGDLFYWSFSGSYSATTTVGGGFIGGATIDGTGTTGAATGIHFGDIESMRFEVWVQNFTNTAPSWGVLVDNQNHFTERMAAEFRIKNCGTTPGTDGHIGFNVGGATTSTRSFKGLDLKLYITANSNQQDGLVLMNGAFPYDGRVFFSGNFTGGVSATTAAAVRISGTVPAGHPNSGSASQFKDCELLWTPECSSGSNTPTTLIIGTASGGIVDCAGLMDWNSNFGTASITSGGSFKFDGLVDGDTGLGTRRFWNENSPQIVTTGATITSRGTAAVLPVSSAGNVTAVVLQTGNNPGADITLVNTGSHSITFDVSGTSNVADGASDVIAALTSARYVWEATSQLWYRSV